MAARKVLLLGVTLLLPVLAFLFLNVFGRNAYKLRTYLPEQTLPARVGAQPVPDTVYHRVADTVALTAAPGTPLVPARELADRIVVLGFGDATCAEGNCRAMLRGLARLQEAFRPNPDVKLLFVAPGVPVPALAALAERNGAIGGKWHFATADAATVERLRQELRETATDAPPGRLWLLDRQRYVRGIYKGGDPRDVERLLTEIDVLLEIEKQSAPR